MERLTYWNETTNRYEVNDNGTIHSGSITDRLAEYEGTGLTPIDIALNNDTINDFKTGIKEANDNLDEAENEIDVLRSALKSYRDAEEQGLLVRLPCKANDTLYWITEQKVIKAEVMAISIEIGEKGTEYIFVEYKTDGWGNGVFITKNFGETVFLTHTEAEAKLKGGAPTN